MNGGGVPDSQKCVPSSYHSVDAYGLMSLWLATTGGIGRKDDTTADAEAFVLLHGVAAGAVPFSGVVPSRC